MYTYIYTYIHIYIYIYIYVHGAHQREEVVGDERRDVRDALQLLAVL